jgi:hypothetical protein
MDPKFLASVEEVKKAGIDVNEAMLERMFKRMVRYQLPEFPLWLLARELGSSYVDFEKGENIQLSKNISTIVLEEYFLNYTKNISFIISELKRISGNHINLQVINESTFDEEESPDVTIEFKANGEAHTITNILEPGSCDLEFRFVNDELIPRIKGTVTKGNVLCMNDGFSFTFIFTEDLQKFQTLPLERGYEQL